jgi:hypothetical protein
MQMGDGDWIPYLRSRALIENPGESSDDIGMCPSHANSYELVTMPVAQVQHASLSNPHRGTCG